MHLQSSSLSSFWLKPSLPACPACSPVKVENYMNDIIFKMRNELRLITKESVADYAGKPRDKWQFDWPSQVILVVNQIYWCQEVEEVRG
jgi:hypothetical protein